MPIFITGVAGFIGFHLCKRLIMEGETVFTLDNLNNYYDVKLKKNRIKTLQSIAEKDSKNFEFSFKE